MPEKSTARLAALQATTTTHLPVRRGVPVIGPDGRLFLNPHAAARACGLGKNEVYRALARPGTGWRYAGVGDVMRHAAELAGE